jgi:NADH-quinone oxidoreductase subunit B
LINGLIALQEKIDQQSIADVPWYRKSDPMGDMIPVPVLGPDLVDLRQLPLIEAEAAKAQVSTAEVSEAEAVE